MASVARFLMIIWRCGKSAAPWFSYSRCFLFHACMYVTTTESPQLHVPVFLSSGRTLCKNIKELNLFTINEFVECFQKVDIMSLSKLL